MLGALGLFFELLPELEQEVVDGARGAVVVGAPDDDLDLLAREDAAAGLDEAPEHVKFGGGQLDQGAGAEDLAGAGAHRDIVELDLVRGLGLELRVAAQHGLHAGQQLGQAEGLGDVVFGAQLEAHDLVHLGASGAEHHDQGVVLVLAQAPQHLEAVHLGQHDVEDDQAELFFASQRQAQVAVVGQGDLVALGREVHFEAHGDALVILDDQDTRRGGLATGRGDHGEVLAQGRAVLNHGASGGCIHPGARAEGLVVQGTREAWERGSRRVKVEPRPGSLSSSIEPPWARTTWATMARPRPEPSRSRERRSSMR